MHSRHSLTALGLPGRLTIRVRPRTPATPRESMPKGVCFRLSARMASAMPGASRSITARVASGVTSRGARPVPPVVRIKLRRCSSHHARSVDSICERSSGTIAAVRTSASGRFLTRARIVSPLVSWRNPRAPPSLIVSTPMVIILLHPRVQRELVRGQRAHQRAYLATRTKDPHGILVPQILDLDLAAHLAGQLARNVEHLPALSRLSTARVEREPAQALVLAERGVQQFVQLVDAKDDLQRRRGHD